MGYLPSPYLEAIQRRPQQGQITAKAGSEDGSRANTMTGKSSRVNTMTGSSRASSLVASSKVGFEKGAPIPPKGKAGDSEVEGFQRAAFSS